MKSSNLAPIHEASHEGSSSSSGRRFKQVVDSLELSRDFRKSVAIEEKARSTGSESASSVEMLKQRIRYLEQERAKASKVRVQEIKDVIQRAQELDIAFLVDATGSMQPSMDVVKHGIEAMASGITRYYPQCKLRFALAIYRDYDDTDDDATGCDFTTSYKTPNSDFSRALSRIKCKGGKDLPEDVFTGLETAANLDWQSTNRLLVHIGDAPCHGSQFHTLEKREDHYYKGDKFGRDIQGILHNLRVRRKITRYCFCHITNVTIKMIHEFRKAAGDDSWVEEWSLSDLSKVPEKVVAVARRTISKSLSVVHKGTTTGTKYVKEFVVKTIPNWSDLKTQVGVVSIHKKCSSLRALLETIRRKCPLEQIKAKDVQLRIALHPFSDEGSLRYPYYAMVGEGTPRDPFREVVIKRFKTPVNISAEEVHAKDCYVNQMEVQTVAQHMAEEFNKSTARLPVVKRIEYLEASLLQVGGKFYMMEDLLRGKWIRFSTNADFVNMTSTLQAFSHWTYHVSGGLLMVTDLQGVKLPDERVPGDHFFRLCDPAINTHDENVMRFTRTNLGEEGLRLFLDSHKCNDVCRQLGLPVGIAGYTDTGTRILVP